VRIYDRALTASEVQKSVPGSGGLLGSGKTEGIPVRLTMVNGSSIEGILVGTDSTILLIEVGSGAETSVIKDGFSASQICFAVGKMKQDGRSPRNLT
jgi:hypothetical protein